MVEEAAESIEIPSANVGRLIGLGGSTIEQIIRSTGCQIEVPKQQDRTKDGKVFVRLSGSADQCRRAAVVIADVVRGGEVEDHAGRAGGAMVIQHNLEGLDRDCWAAWRLVPAEVEHGIRVEMGHRSVRVWAQQGHRLAGTAAEHARASVEAGLAEARELTEIIVDCKIEHEPENVRYDSAIGPLVFQYGVLIHIPRPEDSVVPLRIVGPTQAARDAASLIQARYVKGKSTASVMQLPSQVQGLAGQAAADFQNDSKALEAEYKVKLQCSITVLWISGTNKEAVDCARYTIREMLQFYFPDHFHLRMGYKSGVFSKLREDKSLRALMAKPDCVVAFDDKEGSVWIACEFHAEIQHCIDRVAAKWSSENWEMELSDYSAAMWLLGPKGTGEYLARMQAESGARIMVDPVRQKVSAEGTPGQVRAAESIVRDALARLEQKKTSEADRKPVAKKVLSDHPPHMKAILEKLAELDAKQNHALQQQRIRERELEWGRGLEPTAVAPGRSRSRDRQPDAAAS